MNGLRLWVETELDIVGELQEGRLVDDVYVAVVYVEDLRIRLSAEEFDEGTEG